MPKRKPWGRPTQTNQTDLDFNQSTQSGKTQNFSDTPINGKITLPLISSQLLDDRGQPIRGKYGPTEVNYFDFDLENSSLGFNGAKITRLAPAPDDENDVDQLQIELFVSPGSRKTIAVDAGAGRSIDRTTAKEVNNKVGIRFDTGSIAYRVYSGVSLIEGGDESDFLYGGSGNETIDGKAGADYMNGGGGNDIYIVDNEDDYIDTKSGMGVETVRSSVSWDLSRRSTWVEPSATGLDHLTLTGVNDINGTGNYVSNRIEGNSGNNILNGFESVTQYKNIPDRFGYRETRDLEQQDTLIGGGGADTFVLGDSTRVFYTQKGNKDYAVITDFTPRGFNFNELDTIQLKGSISDYNLRSAQGVGGFSASDTAIFYKAGGGEQLIGIVKNWSSSLVAERLLFV